MPQYDVIVVGAGSTGENVADYCHKGGLSAVLVEAELVGGECSYWACMPSKALLRPGIALTEARSLAGSREAVTGELDVPAVLSRRDSFASNWDDSSQVSWAEGAGLTVIRGAGRLTGPRQVRVDTVDGPVELIAQHAVVVCTGTTAALPPVDGLAAVRPWTAREATSAKDIPGRLIVLGGGVVGCEMATAYRSFGAVVTLLERSAGVLRTYEHEAGKRVAAALRAAGVDVRTEVTVSAARRLDDGTVRLSLNSGEDIEADEVLVAAGRAPATNDIGLDSVGLSAGGWLDVDDTLRVSGVDGGWLYAAGDVNHRALLTHMGKYQARACAAAIVARATGTLGDETPDRWTDPVASSDDAAVPQVVFTDPELAAVGLTEQQARDRGLNVRAVTYEIGHTAGGALYADGYDGWAKLVVDTDREVAVGVTFVGPGVGELIHAATVAVVGEVPMSRLWHAVPSYPTISEIWLRLLEAWRSSG